MPRGTGRLSCSCPLQCLHDLAQARRQGYRALGGAVDVDVNKVPLGRRQGAAWGDPRVFLAGYGPQASTIGANRAGRMIARQIMAML